jgi:flagellin-specific chaperone FliS
MRVEPSKADLDNIDELVSETTSLIAKNDLSNTNRNKKAKKIIGVVNQCLTQENNIALAQPLWGLEQMESTRLKHSN